jgi:dihydropteroate synthase
VAETPGGKSVLSTPREILCEPKELRKLMQAAGTDGTGSTVMSEKARVRVFRVDGLKAPAANILKQEMLSVGGDCANHHDVILGSPPRSTVHLIGTRKHYRLLAPKLTNQQFALSGLGKSLLELTDRLQRIPKFLTLPEAPLSFGDGPLLMGILNLTPDSFSDGGDLANPGQAVARGLMMVAEGAGILDLGAESTRPGAATVTAEEEIRRLEPVLRELVGRCNVPISIDTRKAAVAAKALEWGAVMVNDISGLTDPRMAELVADSGAAVVLMHMQGAPETMQGDPQYDDPVDEIYRWLESRVELAIRSGIDPEKIVIDPGIGFGKRLQDNCALIRRVGEFHSLGRPILLGASRKSFLGTLMDQPDPALRLNGSLAAAARAAQAGVQILRVHDVAATRQFLAAWRPLFRES